MHYKLHRIFKLSTFKIAIYAGITAVIIGLTAFTLSWNLWDVWGGPLPGYKVYLFPGNLTLIYIWHPLFTEEVNFWPKLGLLMLGQFTVVAGFTAIIVALIKKLIK
jgi:hypothetical protein